MDIRNNVMYLFVQLYSGALKKQFEQIVPPIGMISDYKTIYPQALELVKNNKNLFKCIIVAGIITGSAIKGYQIYNKKINQTKAPLDKIFHRKRLKEANFSLFSLIKKFKKFEQDKCFNYKEPVLTKLTDKSVKSEEVKSFCLLKIELDEDKGFNENTKIAEEILYTIPGILNNCNKRFIEEIKDTKIKKLYLKIASTKDSLEKIIKNNNALYKGKISIVTQKKDSKILYDGFMDMYKNLVLINTLITEITDHNGDCSISDENRQLEG